MPRETISVTRVTSFSIPDEISVTIKKCIMVETILVTSATKGKQFWKINTFWLHECFSNRFPTKMLLGEHVMSHDGQKPFECSTCAKTFASKYCLRIHLKTHQVRPRPFTCAVCPKTFMKPEHLAQHEKTHTAKKVNDRLIFLLWPGLLVPNLWKRIC
jgi:Zinc finger, C2H2 type